MNTVYDLGAEYDPAPPGDTLTGPAASHRHSARAAHTLGHYLGSCLDPHPDPDTALIDLLADLQHMAHILGLDFDAALLQAQAHFDHETEQP